MSDDVVDRYINIKGWDLYVKLSKSTNTIDNIDTSTNAIVFIHGLASTHQSFNDVSSILQRNGYITACIDLKGHGNSINNDNNSNTITNTITTASTNTTSSTSTTSNDNDNEVNEFTISSLANDVADIIITLRNDNHYEHCNPWLKPVLLIGHSYGGTIALEVASNYPSLIQGIICIDGGHINLKKSFPNYDDCERELHPPDFEGLRWNTLEKAVREQWCRDWPENGILSMLNNFKKVEVQLDLDDYTTKFPKADPESSSSQKQAFDAQLGIELNQPVISSPKLKVEHVMPKLLKRRHLLLLKNLWEYNPIEKYPLCQCPVLLLPTGDGGKAPFTINKKDDVKDATELLVISNVIWFDTAEYTHDLPSQFPKETADTILCEMKKEYFISSL